MKKFSVAFLSAITLVALTTGCSSTEILEEGPALQTGAITFGTTNVAKASRAGNEVKGTLSNDEFDNFYVFGTYNTSQLGTVNLFTGEAVSKQESGEWTYEDTRYWLPDATYNFYGYSCGNQGEINQETGKPANAMLTNGVLQIKDYKLHASHDLIYAQAIGLSGKEYSDNPKKVDMQFRHILTRLKFSFHGEVPSDEYTMKVTNIKLSGLLNEATYDGTWWGEYSETKTSLDIETENGGSIVPCTGTDNLACVPVFVLPNQKYKEANNESNIVQLIFTMVIERDVVENGETVTKPVLTRTVAASWNPDWAQGKSLNNVIGINFKDATGLKPIEFSASIVKPDGDNDNDTWVDSDGGLTGLKFTPMTEVQD